MDFIKPPEDVLKDDIEVVQQYKEGISILHHHLTQLHTTIFILERVEAFPFELFPQDTSPVFFNMVKDNFSLAAIVIIHRLASDKGGNAFTLKRFKNWVKESVRQEYQKTFKDYVKDRDFDVNSEPFVKIKAVRDKAVAHYLKDELDDPNVLKRFPIYLGELKAATDALTKLIEALSFNVERMMLPPHYSPMIKWPPGTDERTDIERIFDSIAHESPLLNEPETNPALWQHRRETLSAEIIETINSYRRKFGLPEA